jgi:hypothetical protein
MFMIQRAIPSADFDTAVKGEPNIRGSAVDAKLIAATTDKIKNVGDYCREAGVTNEEELNAIVNAGYEMTDQDVESFLSTFASATQGGGNVQEAVKTALGVKTATAGKLLTCYNKIET